jgi:ribosomal protein S18 acetylase RimI-like enzyme
MNNQIIIRTLEYEDIPAMRKAFLRAFSDYTLDFDLTEEKFIKKFIEKLNIDFKLSAGAFVGDEMVGFIFSNVGMYQGELTAYNGGSGVVPEHRGRNLTIQIYQFLINIFRQSNVRKCVLEVLTNNKPAIVSYSKVGFKRNRLLRCYKIQYGELNKTKVNVQAAIRRGLIPDWALYQRFGENLTSYLDQTHMLSRNMSNETLLEAYLDDYCVGYAVYQRDLGRISQFGVKKEYRRIGVGASLFQYMLNHSDTKNLTVLNIDDKDTGTRKFLKKIGFSNRVNQYEMIYKL